MKSTSAGQHFEPTGTLSGRFYEGNATAQNEIVLSSDNEVVVVTPTSKSAVRLRVPELDELDWFVSTFRNGKFAVSSTDEESGTGKVTVYELNER